MQRKKKHSTGPGTRPPRSYHVDKAPGSNRGSCTAYTRAKFIDSRRRQLSVECRGLYVRRAIRYCHFAQSFSAFCEAFPKTGIIMAIFRAIFRVDQSGRGGGRISHIGFGQAALIVLIRAIQSIDQAKHSHGPSNHAQKQKNRTLPIHGGFNQSFLSAHLKI